MYFSAAMCLGKSCHQVKLKEPLRTAAQLWKELKLVFAWWRSWSLADRWQLPQEGYTPLVVGNTAVVARAREVALQSLPGKGPFGQIAASAAASWGVNKTGKGGGKKGDHRQQGPRQRSAAATERRRLEEQRVVQTASCRKGLREVDAPTGLTT